MFTSRLVLASSLFLFTGCDSSSDSTLNTDLQAKVKAVTDCIPPQMANLAELLKFADLWRLNDASNNPPDPMGLTWSMAGNTITYLITLQSFSISGMITFHNMDGSAFTPANPPSTVSLSQAIDDVATEMRDANFPPAPVGFMVGEFTFAGTNAGNTVSSMGGTSSPAALTGLIGGSANENELERLSTTEGTAQIANGTPPVQDAIVTTTGNETCVFTFRTVDLQTDTIPNQEYPIGTIDWSLTQTSVTPNQTVSGTLVFNNTAIAVLNVTDVGAFNVNLETYQVTAQ